MNDWLIKIEQHDHEVREQYPEMTSEEFQSEKMTRVIRELVPHIHHSMDCLRNAIDNWENHVCICYVASLSSDVQVLLK